eukprot:Gb_36140 [translate_table: standard]
MATAQPLRIQNQKTFLFVARNVAHAIKTESRTSALQAEKLHGNGSSSSSVLYTDGNVRILCKQGRLKEALKILHLIDNSDICADSSTYASLLQGCVNNNSLPEGKLVHAHIIQTAFKCEEIFFGNKLMTMYAKCGSLIDARRVLDKMLERNVVSWTVMIAAYARHGLDEEALRLFYEMERSGIQPDQFTFAGLLPACANLAALEHGKKLHEGIVRSGFECNVFVGSALLDMYIKCGSLEDARVVFDKMPERNVVSWTAMIAGYAQNGYVHEAMELFQEMADQNIVSWNAIIAGCAQSGHIDEALDLFQKMPERNVVSWTAMIAGCTQNGRGEEALTLFYEMHRAGIQPNQFTLTSVLPACGSLAALEDGKKVHEKIIKSGFQSNVFVGSALVDMYAKCGSVENAQKVFDRMPDRNVVSWTAMIVGYAEHGFIDDALELFQKMPERNVVSWNAMIAGYAKNGHVNEALELFHKMPEQDAISWTTMIVGYAQNGYIDEARQLFQKMPRRDVISWTAMITVCSQNGQVDEALQLFQKMPEQDVASWNAMITGYAENGHVDEALNLFQKMPKRDLVSWNAMIAGYAQNGYFDDVLKLFRQIQLTGMKPNPDTFANVLPTCANLAALEHGKEVHEDIIRCGFQSDVFVGNALLDMYAKCGSIEDACKVFEKMRMRNVVSWTAMIVAYATHGCSKEALQLFEQMQHSKMKPDHVTFLGVLSACCHAGLVNNGWQYFDYMSRNYHIIPSLKHYSCMVYLLGRAGHLDEAYDFINKMPIKPDAAVWGSLLGACRIHSNIELGEHVAECLFELDPENAAPYVLLSNIYAAAGRWDGIEKVRNMMKDRRVKKMPGCSWIEVNKQVYPFLVGDR